MYVLLINFSIGNFIKRKDLLPISPSIQNDSPCIEFAEFFLEFLLHLRQSLHLPLFEVNPAEFLSRQESLRSTTNNTVHEHDIRDSIESLYSCQVFPEAVSPVLLPFPMTQSCRSSKNGDVFEFRDSTCVQVTVYLFRYGRIQVAYNHYSRRFLSVYTEGRPHHCTLLLLLLLLLLWLHFYRVQLGVLKVKLLGKVWRSVALVFVVYLLLGV